MTGTVKFLVHTFTVSDYDLSGTMQQEIDEWKETEKGIWVLEHSITKPRIHQMYNQDFVGYDVCVTMFLTAEFTEEDAVYYGLKWGNPGYRSGK